MSNLQLLFYMSQFLSKVYSEIYLWATVHDVSYMLVASFTN